VTEKPHRRGDHDEVREWRRKGHYKGKAKRKPERPREKIITPEGVSYSICSALEKIDFGDKISRDRRADKNLSRAASTFFNVL
jgi:hypothetical protein